MLSLWRKRALDHELIEKNYPNRDYHTVYVVEIEKILVQRQ